LAIRFVFPILLPHRWGPKKLRAHPVDPQVIAQVRQREARMARPAVGAMLCWWGVAWRLISIGD